MLLVGGAAPTAGSDPVTGALDVASTVNGLQCAFPAQCGEKSAFFLVGAGDLISASPFESSLVDDEPTIEVLDAMGLAVSSVGNECGHRRRHVHRRPRRARHRRRSGRRGRPVEYFEARTSVHRPPADHCRQIG